MTNYEIIKSMSVEEMAKFFSRVYLDGYYDGEHECIYGTRYNREWLEQEAEDDG